MMNRIVASVFGVVAGLLLLLPGTAAADPPFKVIAEGSSTNLCNGDEVPLVGKLMIQQIEQGNGDIIFNTKWHATGVGQPSGAEYVLNLQDHAVFTPGQPLEVRATAKLTSKGNEPNFATLVIQENGVYTLTTECRG
jgi:hypothetical protein